MADRRAFAAAVWDLVRRIPEGRATTYGQLAEAYYGVAKALVPGTGFGTTALGTTETNLTVTLNEKLRVGAQ